MNIFVQIKQIGKRRDVVQKQPFILNRTPYTVQELFNAITAVLVDEFNQRTKNNSAESILKYLSPQDITDMASVGKISFDVDYNSKKIDLVDAQKNVHLAFQDGLFRVFLNETELTDLQQPVNLKENDTLVFIRLVMLAGRMW